jgi:hypothetical protein
MARADQRTSTGGAHPTRQLTIIGQDPVVRRRGRILTATVRVPLEDLAAGPRGYRVHVVDYDASENRFYKPLPPEAMGTVTAPLDPFELPEKRTKRLSARAFNERLLADPRFHAQNVYAIVLRTLSHFERALGRRLSWSFGGHQLKVAPHAFAEPNAYYSKRDEGLLFGYFAGRDGPVFTCLSHDIVVHETTHALVDGLRPRLMEPSSPDQAAFHEAFADVVALLSVFSLPEVVKEAVRAAGRSVEGNMVRVAQLTVRAIQEGMLFGLGEQFGDELSGLHGSSLRRSITLKPSPDLLHAPEYREEHRRGEILVAAMLHGFLDVFKRRLTTLGRDASGRLPAARVAEEGADIAGRMLTMAIRALDYLPPTDVDFGDFLSALITSDLQIKPDDGRYGVRDALRRSFSAFGIAPASTGGPGDEAGCWKSPERVAAARARKSGKAAPAVSYSSIHRDALQRDPDEVFRFLWENKQVLGLCDSAHTVVAGVRPCLRVDEDGFSLRETVADYVQILTVRAGELEAIETPDRAGRIRKPKGLSPGASVRLLGGGALLFDEFGKLKYHIRNSLLNPRKQTKRLQHLYEAGFFDRRSAQRGFAGLHLKGLQPELPASRREDGAWR